MKRIICTFLAVFLLVLGCAGCQPTGGNDPTPEPTPTPTPIPDDPSPDDESTVQKPEQLLAAMTLEEKIGQLFIIRPESLDSTLTPEQVHSTRDYGVQALTEEMAAQLSKYPAGGIVFFGKNIAGPEQLEAFLSGLKQIPNSLYESAAIDGASPMKQFWKITMPMLTPTIFFNMVQQIITSFRVFTESYVITNGGPMDSTLTYVLYLYRSAFTNFHMGYSCALAWILVVIIGIATAILFKSQDAWVHYEG